MNYEKNKLMKANEAPIKIYLDEDESWHLTNPNGDSVEYVRTDAFMKKAREAFCKATCNGHPPRSTCTSLGTCKEYDNFVKFLKGE